MPLHYFWRQIIWAGLGVPLMIGCARCCRKRLAKRLSIGAAVLFTAACSALVPLVGTEVNGARALAGRRHPFRFQPSEFLKPFFIVGGRMDAVARARKDRNLPVHVR